LQEAVEEFLTITRQSKTHELLHLNVRYNTRSEGGWQRAVDTLQAERRAGLDVLTDTTPFTFGGHDGGNPSARIFARASRQTMGTCAIPPRRQLRTGAIGTGASSAPVSGSGYAWRAARVPAVQWQNFREIAQLWGKDEWDCYFDILADAGRGMESIQVVGILFTDEHLAEMIRHPLFSLSADTWSSRVDGPLSEVTRFPLPYCGHIHYLTHHVRERGTLTLEECIRKLTSMPATHFGLQGRGLLRPAPSPMWSS
jgi:N-acyl-D-amino-acid deacylase